MTRACCARRARATTRYLDAVIKESLRIRPVIPGVGRVVRERPFAIGGYVVPVGVEINPSIRTIHRRARSVSRIRARSRPSASSDEDAPDTYTWVPFGGGTRRCLGASFAQTEMRVVLARVLERTALAPVDAELAETQFRAITLAPKGGVRVRQDRAPLSATEAAAPQVATAPEAAGPAEAGAPARAGASAQRAPAA